MKAEIGTTLMESGITQNTVIAALLGGYQQTPVAIKTKSAQHLWLDSIRSALADTRIAVVLTVSEVELC